MSDDTKFGILWFAALAAGIAAAVFHWTDVSIVITWAQLLYIIFLKNENEGMARRSAERNYAEAVHRPHMNELRRREIAAVVSAVSLSDVSRKEYERFLRSLARYSTLADRMIGDERSDLDWPAIK